MREGDTVTLDRDVPEPEMWEREDEYYYVHQETGKRIIDESYEARVRYRNTLAEFTEEVEPFVP